MKTADDAETAANTRKKDPDQEKERESTRAEARRVLKDKAASPQARMEAGDLLDRTDVDHGPIATAVAFVILLGLLLMYFATNGK